MHNAGVMAGFRCRWGLRQWFSLVSPGLLTSLAFSKGCLVAGFKEVSFGSLTLELYLAGCVVPLFIIHIAACTCFLALSIVS